MKPVYNVKYALTKGIIELTDYTRTLSASGESIYYPGGCLNHHSLGLHGENREWCETPEAAMDRAYELRNKKIKSLENQIAKLRGMEFTTDDIIR